MLKVLEAVEAKFSAKREQQSRSYQAIVIALADGHEIDADEIALVLEAVNKTPGNLESDVSHVTSRREKRDEMRQDEMDKAKIPTLQAAIAAAEAELQAARVAHSQKVRPFVIELQTIQQKFLIPDSKADYLLHGCQDPQMKNRYSTVQDNLKGLSYQLQQHHDEITDVQDKLESAARTAGLKQIRDLEWQETGDVRGHPQDIIEAKRAVKRLQGKLQGLRDQGADLRNQKQAMERELADLRTAMINSDF